MHRFSHKYNTEYRMILRSFHKSFETDTDLCFFSRITNINRPNNLNNLNRYKRFDFQPKL